MEQAKENGKSMIKDLIKTNYGENINALIFQLALYGENTQSI